MKFVKHINILDGPFVHSSTSSPTPCSERVYLDPSKYSGACTVYTEIVYTNTSASGPALSWTGIGSNGVNGITLSGNVSTPTLVRSSAGTLTSSANEGFFSVSALGSAGTLTIKSARLVIIQDTGTDPLVATESQFEIGNKETGKTNTTIAALSAPKYYKHEAADWDGTLLAYAEVVYQGTGTMYAQTFRLQKSTDFSTWTDVVTIVNAASTSSTLTRTRSASFTLEDGNYYRLAGFISNSMESYSVYNAKIIIEQFEGGYETSDSGTQGLGGNSSQEAVAQSFQITKADSITGVRLKLKKTGSPTDNLTVQLVSTLGGTVLASSSISGSSLTTSLALYDITFGSPYSPTINTTYYLQVVRSGSLDSSNLYAWQLHTSGAYSLGGNAVRASGAWGSVTPSFDSYFILLGSTGVTKTVSEALAANTTLAAGTSLQNFLVKYDPAEYDGVDIDFIHQVDASDNNTSVVEIDQQPFGYYTSFDFTRGIFTGGQDGYGQSFKAKHSGDIKSCVFKLSKSGSPTGNAYAKIYAHSGTYGTSSIPTGSPLAVSDALDVSTLTTSPVDTVLTFSGANIISLTEGTNYVAVIEYVGGNSSNYLAVSTTTTPTHDGNMSALNDAGTTWTSFTTDDMYFYVLPDPYQIAGSVAALPDNVGFSYHEYYTEITGFRPLDNAVHGIGQSFVGNGKELSSVSLFLSKLNSPTGNAVVKIYAHSGTYGTSSVPTGVALATSETIDVSIIPTTRVPIEFRFTNKITPTNSVNYVLAIEYSNGDATNRIGVWVDSSSPTHGGNESEYNGSTWTANSVYDLGFGIRYDNGLEMPGTSGNLDVKATTNSGSVYASKILAKISKTAAVLIPRSWGAIIGA